MQVSAHYERLRGEHEKLCKTGIPWLRKERKNQRHYEDHGRPYTVENFLSVTSLKKRCVRKLSFHKAAMVVVCESLWFKRRRLQ
jgi:hypothetical protein